MNETIMKTLMKGTAYDLWFGPGGYYRTGKLL